MPASRLPSSAKHVLTLKQSHTAVSSEPVTALGQGQEPAASGVQPSNGFLLMTNTVLIYVDTSKQVGDKDHLKVFANEDAAETWLQENDPEGVAFEYEVLD